MIKCLITKEKNDTLVNKNNAVRNETYHNFSINVNIIQ